MYLKRFSRSYGFAALLNFLIPGLGHAYWRDYLFGLFVLLVMIIASVLVFFSFLAPLPTGLKAVLFGLPFLFYLFSFVDLHRSIRRRRAKVAHSDRAGAVVIVGALLTTLLLPLSPANFLIRNHPGFGVAAADGPGRSVTRGDIYLVDRTAFRVDLFFLDEPYLRSTPERWDPIAFESDAGEKLGLVIGHGGEEVTFLDGALLVDGVVVEPPADLTGLDGEIGLTRVESGYILVATLGEGGRAETAQISAHNVVGKVHRLF